MINKLDFWEQKTRISKPTMKNKTICTLEDIALKYKMGMGEVIENVLVNKIDYLAEHKEFKKNYM